jgi:hypothetical protein
VHKKDMQDCRQEVNTFPPQPGGPSQGGAVVFFLNVLKTIEYIQYTLLNSIRIFHNI